MELNGVYEVMYKHPNQRVKTDKEGITELNYFNGNCENFTPAGLCAFKNNNNEFLLVHYKDIVQMKLIVDNT